MVHLELQEAYRDTKSKMKKMEDREKETDTIRRDVLGHRYFLTSIGKERRMLFFHTHSQQTHSPFLKYGIVVTYVMAS